MNTASPNIKRRKRPSSVWFLPFIALLIAGWMVYDGYSKKGIMIEVDFASANGLEKNKTKIMYRGMPAGIVKDLHLNDDLNSVSVQIEMATATAPSLTESAKFWLVKPQISLSGVQGLETLLSGYYIGFQPGNELDKGRRSFNALNQPPPPLKNAAGLYITLAADTAQTLYPGAKVYYKEIAVGEVLSHALTYSGKQVHTEIYIEPRYTHLVRRNTRFWNASGIKIKADLPKIDVKIGSLASIIAGGIHFSAPDKTVKQAQNGQTFQLYKDYDAAEDGLSIALQFPAAAQVLEGTLVKSQGIEIGRVTKVALSEDYRFLETQLLIDPRATDLLREGSRFWLHKPHISLAKLSGISALLRGSHIELEPGKGAEKRQFVALDMAPAQRTVKHGVGIILNAPSLGSISQGSPILYKNLPVGSVTGYELAKDSKSVLIYAQVDKTYTHLINATSRFWNMSGIDFQASLDGISLKTGTITTLVEGGISFITDPTNTQKPAKSGFKLHRSFNDAIANSSVFLRTKDRLNIRFHTEDVGGLTPGTPILYKKLPVGELIHTSLNKDGKGLTLHAQIDKDYKHLVTTASRFWHTRGISAEVTLKQVKVETESLKSLVQGGIAFENHGKGQKVKANALFALYSNKLDIYQQPLTILVDFPAGKAIQPLADVRYKGQKVGQVRQVKVKRQGQTLEAEIHLFKDGHFLAKDGSQFWVTAPKISLTGIQHPEGILTGNYIDSIAGTGDTRVSFKGLTKAPASQGLAGLNIIVRTPDTGSLLVGSPVLFRKLPVGEVTGFDLAKDGKFVEVYVNIQPDYAQLVNKKSQFINMSGIEMDISIFKGVNFRADSLASIIGGGLSFNSPQNGAAISSGHVFELDSE